ITVTAAEPVVAASMACMGGWLHFGADTTGLATDHPAEPLRALISAAEASRDAETAIVQVLARPAAARHKARLRQATTGAPGGLAGLFDIVGPRPPRPSQAAGVRGGGGDGLRHRQSLFEVSVRYAVATIHDGRARGPVRHRLTGRAHALAAGLYVFAGVAGIRRRRLVAPAAVVNSRAMAPLAGRVMTVEELAGLAHVPCDDMLPQLSRAGARPVAPVAAICSGGRNHKTLGVSAVTGRTVAVSAADARHHLHIVGSTGVGKSTLLANLVLSDIRDHRGVVLIDPKGDLVTDILDRLDPQAVAGRVCLIDPDQTHPAGINPLRGGDKDLVVDNFVGICRRIWERHWGPRADDILRSTLLTLVAFHDANLEALVPMLSKKAFRAPVVADIDDPAGLGGFWDWYDNLAPGVQSQAIGPVLSRIRALMTNRFVRATIGAPSSDIDLSRVLDNSGILLARLPKGQLGDDTARLLGSVIVARVWQAATARARTPEDQRRDASLYIDEAHNFLTLPRSLDEILAEARGYRLSMVLAHQHMAQLPREMQFAISANARTKIFFTASPEDARLLARHTLPHLSEHDLSHLEAHTAACRTITAGREQPPFTLATHPPAPVIGRSDAIRVAAGPPPAPPHKPTQTGQDT
ncbi:MAG: type IV secretory system conjugative DNA transfer family protein, partial [Stackebrandtia sp.]